MKKEIRIASRESRLALVQTELVKQYIEEKNPDVQVKIIPMKTTGDKILDKSLDAIGGKGLFLKELERALLRGEADIAVHSLKDVPMEENSALPLIAYSRREDPRDVLVLPAGEEEIDWTKPIGCSSARRRLQFQQLYPKATFAPLRGNVLTRLKKLDDGAYGAILLAAAGLKRLGLTHRISRYFSTEEIVPAAGQGILAVQGRAGEDASYLDGFEDEEAKQCALAERAYVRALGGGCSAPTAAYAAVEDGKLTLRGVYEEEGRLRREVLDATPAAPCGCHLP